MKRAKDLYSKIIDIHNIQDAFFNALSNKPKKHKEKILTALGKKYENPLKEIQRILQEGWVPSKYTTTSRKLNNKIREISTVPFFPDRVIHHAIMNIVQPILEKSYITDTYQSIKGRGVHLAVKKLQKKIAFSDHKYVLKIDIAKFYPSVDNQILKDKISKKIKCKQTLKLINALIDSYEGLPIGNYSSQTFGNFYLTDYDHYMKEHFQMDTYIRYADDILMMGSKAKLNEVLEYTTQSFKTLNLRLNSSTQIFPIKKRYIDFIGFRFYETHTRPRKAIMYNTIRPNSFFAKNSLFGWYCASNTGVSSYVTWLQELINTEGRHYVGEHLLSIKRSYNENIRNKKYRKVGRNCYSRK